MGARFKGCFRLPTIEALDARSAVGVSTPYPFQAVRSGIFPTTTRSNRPAEEAICSTGLHRR